MEHSEKPFLETLAGEKMPCPPIWFMRQAGRYLPEYRKVREKAGSFLDLCYSPELAVEVALQPVRRFELDAAILFSDILVVPDALGQKVWFEDGRGPVLDPVRTSSDIDRLERERVTGHLKPVFEAVTGLRESLPKGVALIGFAGAPWTVATYMVAGESSPDQAAAKLWAYREPDVFQRLIDILVDTTGDYLVKQVEAGAEVIQLFDTWSGSLPEPWFRRFCLEPVKALVTRLKRQAPHIPVIGFPKGAGSLYEPYFRETGITAVSLDASVDPFWAARHLQPTGVVQGNLDPLLLLAGNESMFDATRSLVETFQEGPYIFNLGHGILPRTPPENVARLVRFIRETC